MIKVTRAFLVNDHTLTAIRAESPHGRCSVRKILRGDRTATLRRNDIILLGPVGAQNGHLSVFILSLICSVARSLERVGSKFLAPMTAFFSTKRSPKSR